MINKQNKVSHLNEINHDYNLKSIQALETQLNNIFRNGIKDPIQVPYVHQLLKKYYSLAGVEYKINEENSII